ncbi:RusA family crossover junction endodeoxyribonuclease [Mesorhizobium sp. 1B3]|uniref:RusA family crossover junction endodeoxyribonuclease n=1 Tax=Mesorhizobium sp. 1B3 TaxID=3243599 RepID=UPI003D98D3BB
MEPDLPLELLVRGYPVSHQAKRKKALENWKNDVRRQARAQMEPGHFALQRLLKATVYFFPQAELEPDLDNATKPVLDGLSQCVYIDDRQIERLIIQRFEPGRVIPLLDDSPRFNEAVASDEPIIYIRLEAFGEDAR